MKTILSLLLAMFSLASFAQGINISFSGSRTNKNYQVVIDGMSYYSTNPANTSTTQGRKTITLPNMPIGSHTLDIYRLTTNSQTYPNGSTNAPVEGSSIYNKTFQTRANYDMTITVRDNGTVSFTESKAKTVSPTGTVAMSNSSFSSLYNKVKAQRYQSQKISMIKTAFATKANNFTSSQVKQLISLVSSENSRFDLAKLSYHKVINKDEFIIVYDALQSEAKRDALDEYVVSQGGVSTEGEVSIAPIVESPVTRTPMSSYTFDQAVQRLQNISSPGDRFVEIRTLFNNSANYFATAQIRRLLSLVPVESDRLALAKLAWSRAYEPATFNQLTDMFSTASYRESLNTFIVNNGGTANNASYQAAMSDAAFTQIYNKAKNHFRPWNTTEDVKAAFNNTANNFSTTQVRQLLLLLASETDRLASAKLAYARTVDRGNFAQLADVFTSEIFRDDFNRFVNSQ